MLNTIFPASQHINRQHKTHRLVEFLTKLRGLLSATKVAQLSCGRVQLTNLEHLLSAKIPNLYHANISALVSLRGCKVVADFKPARVSATTCFRAQSVARESNSERELAQVESTVCFQRKLSSERA